MKLFIKDLLMMYNGAGTVVKFGGLKELTEAGTYEGYVPFDGVYTLEIVGSGGGRVKNSGIGYASGASGGAIVCELYLKKGNYIVEIKQSITLDTYFYANPFDSELTYDDVMVATAYKGGNAYVSGISAVKGKFNHEVGGEVSDSYKVLDENFNVITVNTQAGENKLENDGVGLDGSAKSYSYPEGGASVYNGYGKGWGKTDGTDGYFRLTYLRKNI